MAIGRSHLIALAATAFFSRAFEVKSIKGKLAARGFSTHSPQTGKGGGKT